MQAKTIVITALLACYACGRPDTKSDPVVLEQGSNATAELAALKLSETCAAAAQRFWKRGGYDQPPKREGVFEVLSYTSHYNTRTKKCYISTRTYANLPSGSQSELVRIVDAMDSVVIGSLFSLADTTNAQLKPKSLKYRTT